MQKTNLNEAPYYDDFDVTKNFHRVLFRPGYAVQARELTQLQTILQSQIDRFGSHIFKEGSPVKDGQTTVDTVNVHYLIIDDSYSGNDVDVTDFEEKMIVVLNKTRPVRAKVLAVVDLEGVEKKTLLIRYQGGEFFAADEEIAFEESSSIGRARIRNVNTNGVAPIGSSSIAAINEGIFFIRGHFIFVEKQIIVLDKYDTTPTYKVGLEITETLVSSSDDTSLLDPALDASNYQAPGANRLAIELTLAKRTLTTVDEDNFINLLTVESGAITAQVRYPIYSEIEKVLARRTYDESGNYTVRDFRLRIEDSNTDSNVTLVIDPGKAYVQGFEFETIGPTKIEAPRARDSANVSNYDLAINYGNYVLVQNCEGAFAPDTFSNVEIFCSTINNTQYTTAARAANTRIGTARVRAFNHETTIGSAADSNNYVYRLHVFDVVTTNTTFMVSANNNQTDTLRLPTDFSPYANTYDGVIIRVISGTGSGQRRTISGGTTSNVYVEPAWTTIPDTTSLISFDYQFKDAETIAITNGGTSNVATCAVASAYKDVNGDALLNDTSFDTLVFNLPQQYAVPATLQPASYTIWKKSTITANAGGYFILPTLTGTQTYAAGSGAISSADRVRHFYGRVSTVGAAAGFRPNQFIPLSNTSVTLEVTGGSTTGTLKHPAVVDATTTIDLYSLVDVGVPAAAVKTLVSANTANITYGGVTVVNNSNVAVSGSLLNLTSGQLMLNTAASIVTTPGVPQSLYVPDVVRIVKILDSGNTGVAFVDPTDLSDTSMDITDHYTLDKGHRDGYYDHSSIILKAGKTPPRGRLLVLFDYYTHTGSSFFTIDSYPDANTNAGYLAVPSNARDAIDMRPVRKAAIATNGPYNFGIVAIGATESDMRLSYNYYLPRIDNLVLTSDRQFEVIRGTSSVHPSAPSPRTDAMQLFKISYPAYTANASDAFMYKTDNRRYTMRDIGSLDQRITNLEYYTSLSLLEQSTINKNDLTLLDDNGLMRTKNGIVADNFEDFSISDALESDDFSAALDTLEMKLHPAQIDVRDWSLGLSNVESTYHTVAGPRVSLVETASVNMITQDKISRAININPFAVTRWNGTLQLDPTMDTWVDTSNSTVLTIDRSDPALAGKTIDLGITWSPWQQIYYGTDSYAHGSLTASFNPAETTEIRQPGSQWSVRIRTKFGTRKIATYETVVTNTGTRVLNITIVPFIREKSIILRSENLRPNTVFYPFFDGVDMKNNVQRANILRLTGSYYTVPFTEERYDTYGTPQVVRVGVTTTPQTPGNGYTQNAYALFLTYSGTKTSNTRIATVIDIGHARGNAAKYANSAAYANTIINANNELGSFSVINKVVDGSGVEVTQNAQIALCEHYSGRVRAGSNTHTVFVDPSIANSYVYISGVGLRAWKDLAVEQAGSPDWSTWSADGRMMFRIVRGANTASTIQGKAAQIQQFVLNSGNPYFDIDNGTEIGLNGIETTTLYTATAAPIETNSIYSIGLPSSTENGALGAILHIPKGTIKTGQRLVKVLDDAGNDEDSATAIASGEYTASGLSQTTETTMLVTREQRIQSQLVRENEVLYTDPLAQSFGIDKNSYPNGVFVKSIRLLFKTKDPNIPVRMQIRPMVNGYPDSRRFLIERTLSPDKVTTVSEATLAVLGSLNISPFSESESYKTEFNFESPLYLAPDQEYAIVLISDSNSYTVWSSHMGDGDVDLRTGAMISSQPYLGSIFKSQNQTTWTPVQEEDLAFQVVAAQYDITKTANVCLNLDLFHDTGMFHETLANSNVDMFFLNTSQIQPPQTGISYKYSAFLASGAATPAPAPVFPLTDTFFEDQNGPRVINTTSNNSFRVYAELISNDRYVSPYIDVGQGASVKTTELYINNGEISNDAIVITNGGAAFHTDNVANMSVTISGVGSGATAHVASIHADGTIGPGDIVIDNPGSGYYVAPTITINSAPGFPSVPNYANASAIILGEDGSSGGNMWTRYVTKKFTLAEGFDAGDLRVYLSAYKPLNANIYVYYKLLSAEDGGTFAEKNWQVMTQLGSINGVSSNRDDIREYTYAPGTGGIADNEVFYDSYNNFRYFALKVVMTTSDRTKAPFLSSMRCIALPSGKA